MISLSSTHYMPEIIIIRPHVCHISRIYVASVSSLSSVNYVMF